MHILGMIQDNDIKKIAVFWVIDTIKYIYLQLSTLYSSWNIKVVYNKDVINGFRKNLQILGIFGKI